MKHLMAYFTGGRFKHGAKELYSSDTDEQCRNWAEEDAHRYGSDFECRDAVEVLALEIRERFTRCVPMNELAEAYRRNAVEMNPAINHVADFCDANITVANAFEEATGEDMDIRLSEHMDLVAQALTRFKELDPLFFSWECYLTHKESKRIGPFSDWYYTKTREEAEALHKADADRYGVPMDQFTVKVTKRHVITYKEIPE